MSKIEWTEKTFNPITGCNKVSEGCFNCYAQSFAKRLQAMGSPKYRNGFNLELHAEALKEPKLCKKPSMYFVCSMADLFHGDVPFRFIDGVFDVIRECPQHTFQVLTKRPENMVRYFNSYRGREYCEETFVEDAPSRNDIPPNVWLGTTVEMKKYLPRMRLLDELPQASVRFISVEPMLDDFGEMNFHSAKAGREDKIFIDWVICGGESGRGARLMKREWAERLQEQCAQHNIPFFFKQWGAYGEDGKRRNKTANGKLLKGEVFHEMPRAWACETMNKLKPLMRKAIDDGNIELNIKLGESLKQGVMYGNA